MTRQYTVDGIDTRLHEHRIADDAAQWDGMNALDEAEARGPDVCEDHAALVVLDWIAWRLYFDGDIDAVCRDDLLEIIVR